MPSSSTKQRNYILYLRGKYKTKSETPSDQRWIWNDEWLTIKESSFSSELKAWIDPEGNYLPFLRIKNHDDVLPLGLRYGDALRKGWIRLYKTPERIHITCYKFDAKELKCCMKIFNQVEDLRSLPIVVASGSKIINYNPLFKEKEERVMKRYVRQFKEETMFQEAVKLPNRYDLTVKTTEEMSTEYLQKVISYAMFTLFDVSIDNDLFTIKMGETSFSKTPLSESVYIEATIEYVSVIGKYHSYTPIGWLNRHSGTTEWITLKWGNEQKIVKIQPRT